MIIMADRLVRVLDDPELGRRMGEAGLVRAREHFSWEAIGVKTADLYRSLVWGARGVQHD